MTLEYLKGYGLCWAYGHAMAAFKAVASCFNRNFIYFNIVSYAYGFALSTCDALFTVNHQFHFTTQPSCITFNMLSLSLSADTSSNGLELTIIKSAV